MKSKKRHHHTSSEESEESELTFKTSSSSGSESDGSSESEHKHRKKRKRDDSSDSESESDDQKRAKKRKHKKKKKKHTKKKRRSDSGDEVASEGGEISSISEGEITSKKKRKHKHKHSRRARDSSASEIAEEHVQRRIHSVVKERRGSSEEANNPPRTYYQKEYRRSESVDYEREREVQRFYRGSSKDRRQAYHEQYNREPSDRYTSYQQDKFDKNRERYGQNSQYNAPVEDHDRRPRDYNEYKRNPRYEEHRPPNEEFQTRPREDVNHSRQETRVFNRYNFYEERGQKRREYIDNREHRDRRVPTDTDRIQEREYPDKKERFREEPFTSGRPREVRRDRPPIRQEKPHASLHGNPPKPRSPDDRYRDRNRRPQQEPREEREDRYTDGRGDERRGHPARNEDRKPERARDVRDDPRARERKSRFTDADDSKDYKWGKTEIKKEGDKNQSDKEKPNFGLSGKLTADANTFNGVVVKYTEPDDAKQPKRRWRFYPFKGDKALPILYIHRQSAFLIGRDKKVADIMLEHPSISKQHAALQFRATPFTRADGTQGRRVRPYIIDLESANGTFVNNKKIEPRRYVELLERDVVKYGFSQREYVLLHENSKDDAQDDDNQEQPLGANVTTTDQIKHEKRIKQETVADGD